MAKWRLASGDPFGTVTRSGHGSCWEAETTKVPARPLAESRYPSFWTSGAVTRLVANDGDLAASSKSFRVAGEWRPAIEASPTWASTVALPSLTCASAADA